jgi:hypothetical protein
MCIRVRGDLVVIDVSGDSSHKLSASYQEFGMLCARRKVQRALLRTGDGDPSVHYALRDVLRTVVLVAGVPVRFRLAVVARTDPIAQVCADMQEELCALGCDARVFRTEGRAEDWLHVHAGKRPARPVIGELAVS